jgi:hypothetical protein
MIAPMVSQFELMHQQMIDEFHQARAMMFEAFTSFHREQSSFLSEELDEIRQLSQDLQTLRNELDRQNQALAEHLSSLVAQTPAPAPPPSPSPSTELVIASGAGAGGASSSRFRDGRTAPFSTPPPPRTEPRPLRVQDDQAHANLCARIITLQKKQQSRWEKVLSLLPTLTPKVKKGSGANL